jgi:hypothetical protein
MTQVPTRVRCWVLTLPLVLAACSVNRPVALAPGPAGVTEYLAAHRPSDLLVTDSAGRSRWVHNPTLDGDTLRGLRNRELPRERLAIPVMQVRSLAAPQFSTGRTLGLVGGVLGTLVMAIVVLAGNGAHPVY